MFGKTKEAKLQTEIANLEEEANLIYSELAISEYIGEATTPTMENIVAKLIERNYKIEKTAISGSIITGITLDKTSITIAPGETTTITVKCDGSSEPFTYFALIDEKYYKMTLTHNGVKVDRTSSEIDNTIAPEEIVATPDNTNVTVENISGSTITLKAGDNAGNTTLTVTYGIHTTTCQVAIKARPKENGEEVEGTTFATNYGRIDVIWLKGTTNEVVSNPNAPIITSNGESMTPIKWDESNNIQTTTSGDTSWYNYGENKWANARTANESYFVWIPRYAYRITYYENETSTIPTGYYDGYAQWKAENGDIRLKLDDGVNTVDYNGEKYIVHPAFDNNLEMGGWSEKTTGFRFAKFEMSGTTGPGLKSTFGVAGQGNQTIGTQYTNARTATYGYTGTEDSFDNKKSYMNSHLIKNSEWGAVAYLTHSSYGRDGQIVTKNDTGYTGGYTGPAYTVAQFQSTTGNIYGIYDMSGAHPENIAAFNSGGDSNQMEAHGWYMATGLLSNSNSTKYATKYNDVTGDDVNGSNDVIYKCGKVGDATKEVHCGGFWNKSAKLGHTVYFWWTGSTCLPMGYIPFVSRGGLAELSNCRFLNFLVVKICGIQVRILRVPCSLNELT